MLNADDILQQQELLAAHRRTVAVYLRRLALVGEANAPPEVANGIAEAREQIGRIKAALRAAGTSVVDLPGDEAPASAAASPLPPGAVTPHSVTTGGGDYAGGEIDKRQGIFLQGSSAGAVIGSTGIVNIYPHAARPHDDPDQLAAAHARLAALPLDALPEHAPLPDGSRMPFARNPLFVGRADDLRAIARALEAGDTAAIGQVAAATGLGGIGKTQLATEFAHRYGQFFAGGVFWLSFANPAAVPAEVAACGALGLIERPDYSALPLDDQVRLVLVAWRSALPRLLIFDNCEEEALLKDWRPPHGGCRVLVTSRRADWDAALGVRALPLDVLPRAESVALMRKFRPDLPEDDRDLRAIAAELGDLPLALHLAGSYLARYRRTITPAAYLAQVRSPALLQHPSMQIDSVSPTGHVQHVGRTFALSYERLDVARPVDALAIELLARAACFAPGEPIPRELLAAALGQHASTAQQLDRWARIRRFFRSKQQPAVDRPHTPLQIEDALSRLVELGLLEDVGGDALRLHRLLSMFARTVSSDAEAQAAVEQVMIDCAHDLNKKGFPAPLLALQPHLRYIADAAMEREDDMAANVCFVLGTHLYQVGDYRGAFPYLDRAQKIDTVLFGEEHHDNAANLNNLAMILQNQGDYTTARSYFERALAICERVLGPDHPDTAGSLNNLGMLLHAQGDYAAVRSYLERALAIWERVLGPDHPNTAQSLNNLGELLRTQGDYAAARLYFERALAICERVLGSDHPTTATSLNNLGMLLHAQGDYAAACPYLERALRIDEVAYGSDHPEVAMDVNNLGMLLYAQGDYAAARPYYERALAIQERVLGPDHPDTATNLNNLGVLLYTQGDYAAARPYYERALAICERVLGPDHPDTALSLNNLGELLRVQGDYAAARPYYERALAICERVLGPDHPNTATNLNNLGVLLYTQGDYAAARPYLERALAICVARLGAEHPTTRTARANLAALDAPPQTREQQIAAITERAEADVAQALAAGDDAERAALAAQLEARAQWAEDGVEEGSSYLALATHLRALATRLGSRPPGQDVGPGA